MELAIGTMKSINPWQYLKLVQETSPGKFLKLLNYSVPLLPFLWVFDLSSKTKT